MTDEIPDDILAASFDLIEAMEANKADASTTSDERYARLLTNDANLVASALMAERAKCAQQMKEAIERMADDIESAILRRAPTQEGDERWLETTS